MFTAGSGEENSAAECEEVYRSGVDSDVEAEQDAGSVQTAGDQEAQAQDIGLEEEEETGLVVYVCGQVQMPGVYELERGSRIGDAVEMAGGMTEEAAADVLNLAQELVDAQMIRVPSKEEVKANGGWESEQGITGQGSIQGTGETADVAGKISLNTATREQLLTLPGIGESKADAILQYRQEKGGFRSIEEIMDISGIKEGVFSKIKDQITV